MSVLGQILTWTVVLSMFSLMYMGAWGIRVTLTPEPGDTLGQRALIFVVSVTVLVLSTVGMTTALGVVW